MVLQIGFGKLRNSFHVAGFVSVVLKFWFLSQEVRIKTKILWQLETVA